MIAGIVGFVKVEPSRAGLTAETYKLAPGLGLEPRLADSESAVLPLDDPGIDERSGIVAETGGLTKSAIVLSFGLQSS